MKKAIPAVLVIFLAGTAVSHSGGLPDAGSTPGSMFFALDRAQESLSLMFTAEEDKPAKRMQFAEERLSEAAKLASKNKSKRALRALELYNKDIAKLHEQSPELANETSEHHMRVLEGLRQTLPETAAKGVQEAMKRSGHLEDTGHHSEDKEETHGFMATGRVIQSK